MVHPPELEFNLNKGIDEESIQEWNADLIPQAKLFEEYTILQVGIKDGFDCNLGVRAQILRFFKSKVQVFLCKTLRDVRPTSEPPLHLLR